MTEKKAVIGTIGGGKSTARMIVEALTIPKSGPPDINTHLSKVTGLERGRIEYLRVSEVYGMQRESMVRIYGERVVQVMTMRFLRKFPIVANLARLKKSRARMMVKALKDGEVTKGNHTVRLDGRMFVFAYRGTDILVWDTEALQSSDGFHDIDAGAFEQTASNANQRRMYKEAVEEFRKVVLCL